MNKWPAVPVVVAMIAGMVMGLFSSLPALVLLVGMVACLLITLFLINSQRWRVFPPLVAFFLFGCLLMQRADSRLAYPLTGEKVGFDAVLLDVPQEKNSGLACEFYVLDGCYKDCRLRLYIKNDSASLNYFGRRIEPVYPQLGGNYRIKTRLKDFRHVVSGGNSVYEGTSPSLVSSFFSKNKDLDSYSLWTKSKGFAAQGWVYPQNIHAVGMEKANLPFMERVRLKAKLLREKLLDAFFYIDAEGERSAEYAILAAMAFGDKSVVTAELRDTYSRTGASHLLALSGMHLGILYAILVLFFGGRGEASQYLSRWGMTLTFLKNLMILMLIWLYVVVAGMPSSVVRAATMLTIYTVVSISGRQKMSVNALAVTALLMLVVNPLMLWDIGFQMSFLAMLSIFVFQEPLHEMFFTATNHLIYKYKARNAAKRGVILLHQGYYLENTPLVGSVLGIITVSIAAQVLTAPLAVFYFNRFSGCFLITNILAIPLVTIMLYLVFGYLILATVIGAMGFAVSGVFVKAIFLMARLMNRSMEWLAGMDMCWDNIHINLPQLLLVYLGIIIACVLCLRIKRMLE